MTIQEDVFVPDLAVFVRNNACAHGYRPTQEEREKLGMQAKAGCPGSRESIVRALYRVAEKKAYRYSEMFMRSNGPCYEDIFQEGVLAGIASVDRALEKYTDPFPYLFRAMQGEMLEYCLYRNCLIRVPETHEQGSGRPKNRAYAITYLSAFTEQELDVLFPDTRQPSEYDTQMHQKLYAAVDRLRGRNKTVIEMRYGLNGQPVSTLSAVSLHISGGKSDNMASSYQSLAMRHLRNALIQEGIH
jgi:DNA-directed RNA polymerase specialized sigma subunit